ncbi:hypothetical protein HK405_005494 [Cladochytrium tenue]|nr:hypothetical protein HK405_005494 [Cladochytrium tenue]
MAQPTSTTTAAAAAAGFFAGVGGSSSSDPGAPPRRATALLAVAATPGTDLYRRPGKVHANADMWTTTSPAGAFRATVRTRAAVAHEYQQAGVVVLQAPPATTAAGLEEEEQAMAGRGDASWVKAGVEFWGGRARLSAVVTRGGCDSDWSVAEFPAGCSSWRRDGDGDGDGDGGGAVEFVMRVTRSAADSGGGALVIEVGRLEGDTVAGWELVRKTYGWGAAPVRVGVMCAAPEAAPSFAIEFSDWSMERL